MSTVQDNQALWSVNESANSKYEKCLNITEEIYKRIDITFQIKKLETATQSDVSDQSDQIDSNELSNETDLFACDKSSISSSTEAEKPPLTKYVNINNNEEKLRPAVVYKRPRKRFRKRVKKRQSKQQSDSDGSSDEGLPLSRIVNIDIDKCASEQESPDNVMGVPHIVIVAKDSKPKTQPTEKKPSKKDTDTKQTDKNEEPVKPIDKTDKEISKTMEKKKAVTEKGSPSNDAKTSLDRKNCNMCSLSFRGDRGLRRHMTMSHIISLDATTKPSEKEMKPA